jgi:putative hydrolase of the HAD superfamily
MVPPDNIGFCMSIQLKAIIFDYGNVLCAQQDQDDLAHMASIVGMPLPEFLPIYWEHRMAYDASEMTPEEYWKGVSPTVNDESMQKLIELDSRSWTVPDPVMIEWANGIRKAGLKTAILSNMPTPLREYLDSTCMWMPKFDFRTFSCDVHMTKPGRGIYQHCLAGLRVAPEEALFLDDREPNVRAAEELGIHGIVFSTPEQAQCEMESKYQLPLKIGS